MDTAQSPEQRAAELLAAMTQSEKLAMLHGGASCSYVGCVDADTRLAGDAMSLLAPLLKTVAATGAALPA